MEMRLYILRTSCQLLMEAHLVPSNITVKLVCQTNIMGTISTLVTFHKMNKSSLVFIGKLNHKRFFASLSLNWSSIVYLKLTLGKRFNLACTVTIKAVSVVW